MAVPGANFGVKRVGLNGLRQLKHGTQLDPLYTPVHPRFVERILEQSDLSVFGLGVFSMARRPMPSFRCAMLPPPSAMLPLFFLGLILL